MYEIEEQIWSEGYKNVVGLDEVGRGCLAGPVVAAGVVLDPRYRIDGLADSKSISEKKRRSLELAIREHALAFSIHWCSAYDIDRFNILKATFMAMLKCVDSLNPKPDYLLVDGNRFADTLIPHQCVIKGDSKSASIAAASIIAKNYRDQWMRRLHENFPGYDWKNNVGYGTKNHLQGIKKQGFTPEHRRSFKVTL